MCIESGLMENKKSEIYKWLKDNNIDFDIVEHNEVYTIEDMHKLNIEKYGYVCKNIFLLCKKTNKYFLVIMMSDKRLNLKLLNEKLERKLIFANEADLEKYLNLKKGAVSPMGIYYDRASEVIIIIDSALQEKKSIGVHPAENTATVFISFDNMIKLIETNGNKKFILDF